MSLSISGYPPGFGHPTAMGVTSAPDFYSAHYPTTQIPQTYTDYGVDERNYIHNWVMLGANGSGSFAVPEAPASPCSYGSSSPGSIQGHPAYADMDPAAYKQWHQHQDYNMTPDLGLPPSMNGVPDLNLYEAYTNSFGERCYRRRTNANKKERRRTLSINNAFSNLRGSIPNVPSDTKLSKIKTLRLAISYIAYLNDVLEKGDSSMQPSGFKADISRRRERRPVVEEKKADSDSDDSTGSEGKGKGRTGWPQTVWASELKSASPN